MSEVPGWEIPGHLLLCPNGQCVAFPLRLLLTEATLRVEAGEHTYLHPRTPVLAQLLSDLLGDVDMATRTDP